MTDRSDLSLPGPIPAAVAGIFASRKVTNQEGQEVELSSNVAKDEAILLYAAVRKIKPLASVEVGFAQGISTLAILEAVKANGLGHHHVVDPFQQAYGYCGREMVRRAGLDSHYTFYERQFDEVAPNLPMLQFAFIDSSHLFDLTLCEFVLIDRRLEVGGVIGLHDMWMPAQQACIRFLLANRAFQLWEPGANRSSPRGLSPPWKRIMRRALARMPGGQRIFSRDFLQPWADFGIGNLVFLQKTDNDRRDWRFYRRF